MIVNNADCLIIEEDIENEQEWRDLCAKIPKLDEFIGEPPNYPTRLVFHMTYMPNDEHQIIYCDESMLDPGKYLNVKTGDTVTIDKEKSYEKNKKQFLIKLS